MNRFIFCIALIVLLGPVSHSQAPGFDPSPKLRALKATNAALIEKQAATLKKLEEMQKDAQQLKTFGKRA